MACNKEASNSLSLQRSKIELELYFLIARFLSNGPCKETSQVLQKELDKFQLLPKRADWTGSYHTRSFPSLLEANSHISPTHLLDICSRIGPILDKLIPSNVPRVTSLLGAGRQSMLRTERALTETKWSVQTMCATQHGRSMLPPLKLKPTPSPFHALMGREFKGTARRELLIPSMSYSHVNMVKRSLGHLAAVYCCLFDRRGEYIFTGSDDHLVKVWSIVTGRLLATLRGHAGEITDLAVSFDNRILASGSCDKTIRVWCLLTQGVIAILTGHSAMVTSLQFCPIYVKSNDTKWLMSTGADSCVCYWRWNSKPKIKFDAKPVKFIERSRAGAQMVASSFSCGGLFLATGNTDHIIRIYCFTGDYPEKICELDVHTDRVDNVLYANSESRFISGSRDGTARIWRFERQEWKALTLDIARTTKGLPGSVADPNPNKQRMTMATWRNNDAEVITAVSDFTLKVWNSRTAELLRILPGHTDEVYVMDCNPTDSRILFSAGHDGNVNLWDIEMGVKIKQYCNNIQGQGHGAILDGKWSVDGKTFAVSDSHGHLLLFGFGQVEKFKKVPEHLFFHTDYRPLIRDSNHYVLDEQTQQPPHLMPPPFLVDIDGNPHSPAEQLLVPGREDCKDMNSLIPHMGYATNGDREIVDVQAQDAANAAEQVAPVADVVSPRIVMPDHSMLDALIERMQQEQDRNLDVDGARSPQDNRDNIVVMRADNQATSPGASSVRSPPMRIATRDLRPSVSDISPPGVAASSSQPTTQRLSPASRSRRNMPWSRWKLLKPLLHHTVRQNEKLRFHLTEEEIKSYVAERKRKPLPVQEDSSSDGGINYRRTRTTVKKEVTSPKRRTRSRRPVEAENRPETAARNLLTTRALYDTEVEESDDDDEDANIEEENFWSCSSPSSNSSDYSDWEQDGTSTNLQPPTRTPRRVPRRKSSIYDSETEDEQKINSQRNVLSDVSDDVAQFGGFVDESRRDESLVNKKKRRRRILSGMDFARPKRRPVASREMTSRPSRAAAPKKMLDMHSSSLSELDERFRPPEWLTDTQPRKAPYTPQMGDEIIYFRQGHEQYVQAVIRLKVYDPDPEKKQPWNKNSNLREHELVKVIGIKHEIKPPRLVCLKLGFIDAETSKLTGESFTIKYHDMADVIDFVVLRQTYNRAMAYNWKVGDRFRSVIDDAWWTGTVARHEPFQEIYPDSQFQCLVVNWDNGEHEKMSPWDLEPLEEATQEDAAMATTSVPVTSDELQAMLYAPTEEEWAGVQRSRECQRICAAFEQVMGLSLAEPFLVPVDLNAYPVYEMIVEYPMDLNTIKSRLENGYYRRLTAVQFDVRYIETNAVKFNEPRSPICLKAAFVTELCLRIIRDKSVCNAMPLYNEMCKDPNFPLTATTAPPVRELRSNDGDRSMEGPSTRRVSRMRSYQEQKETENPSDWKIRCRSLLETVYDVEDSEPFRTAVNPLDYPDYDRVVNRPMDLTTIMEQLDCDNYVDPLDFRKDMRTIFSNSRMYNTNKRSRIYTMTLRLSALVEEHLSDIVEDWKSSLRMERQTRRRKQQHRPLRRMSPRVAHSPEVPVTMRTRSSPPSVPEVPDQRQSRTRSAWKRRISSGESGDETEDYDHVDRRNASSSRKDASSRSVPSRKVKDSRSEQPRAKRLKPNFANSDSSDYAEENADLSRHVRRPKRNVQPSWNGYSSLHGRYGTRHSTGAVKRQRYAIDSSDDDDESVQLRNRNASKQQRALRRERRERAATVVTGDDDDDEETEKEQKDDEEAEENEQDGNEEEINEHRSAYDEDTDKTESDTEVSDAVTSPEASSSLGSPRPIRASARRRSDFSSLGGRRSTRFQGRRTVRYGEESADERGAADSDSDVTLGVSRSGRVRRVTARARAIMGSS